MPRQYSEAIWDQMRQLFVGGMSIRQVAAKTGTPPGSIAAHAARHQWSAQRRQLAVVKGESTADDKEQLVRAIVQENRLKTLEAESKAARLLAERCLKLIEEGGIPVRSLSDVTESQEYRARLWPSVQPVEVSGTLEQKPVLVLHYAHERNEVERQGKDAMVIELDGKFVAPKVSLPDLDTPSEKPKDL
jgi:hypothetical protein